MERVVEYIMDYQAIIDKYKIGYNGFGDVEHPIKFDKLDDITGFIHLSFTKSRKKKNSYDLKHFAEVVLGKVVNGYVSNGEMIVAMISNGYDPKDIRGPNCNFSVDIESTYKSGYKYGLTIWKQRRRIVDEFVYREMEDKDENFRLETHFEGGPHIPYDMSILGYYDAKRKCHEDYPDEFKNKCEPNPLPVRCHYFFNVYK